MRFNTSKSLMMYLKILDPMDVHFDDYTSYKEGHTMKIKFSDIALSLSPDSLLTIRNNLSTHSLVQVNH